MSRVFRDHLACRLSTQRQPDSEDRTGRRSLLHGDVPAMVLDNLLYDRQPHARAIFLTMTYKRLKKIMTNHFRDSWPIVADPYLKALAIAPHPDVNVPALYRHNLASVQQQIHQ